MKHKEEKRRYMNAWRKRDRKRRPHIWKAIRSKWVQQQREWYANLMKALCCMHCGNSDQRVLDWAHLPGFLKIDNVAHMIGRCGSTRTMREMAKCLVLCANCHRIFDYEVSK